MSTPHTAIGVFGIPVNDQGQFLLTQRNAPDSPATHGKWQFAGGGMELGETPEQTLIREFQEELGVTPTILFPHPIVSSYSWSPEDHILLIAYLVSIGNQIPSSEHDHETEQWNWFSYEEAVELNSLPKVKDFLDQARQLWTMRFQKHVGVQV